MKPLRQTNFEVLRIVSILLIVLMHAWGYAFHTTDPLNRQLLLAVNAVGNTGVSLFVLISGWFGVRFGWGKLLRLVLVVWTYSVASYAVELAFLGHPLSGTEVRAAVFPLLSRKYWFMTCYVVLLCFSPWLNRVPEVLARRSLESLLGVWAFFFVVAPTLLGTEIQTDLGKGLVNFTLVYLLGRYLRRYGFPRWLGRRAAWVAAGCCLALWALGAAVLQATGSLTTRFARDNDVLVVLAAVALFRCFERWHPAPSPAWNYVAGFAFPLYLVNSVVLAFLQPWLAGLTQSPLYGLAALGATGLCLAAAVAAEMCRRLLLDRPFGRLADTLERRLRQS